MQHDDHAGESAVGTWLPWLTDQTVDLLYELSSSCRLSDVRVTMMLTSMDSHYLLLCTTFTKGLTGARTNTVLPQLRIFFQEHGT